MIEAIEIANADLTAHILIEPEAFERQGKMSLRCIVEVVSEGFVGVDRTVHYTLADLRAFIAAAQRLMSAQSGEARLEAQSPKELILLLQPLDRSGRLQAIVTMRKPVRAYQAELGWHRLETCFQVDRESLEEAVVALMGVLATSDSD